jgi:hypothetical protein
MKVSYWLRYVRALQRGPRPGVAKLSPIDTLRRITSSDLSFARFGDGELKLALYRRGLRFQDHSERLERMLNEALLQRNDRLLRACNHLYASIPEERWLVRYEHYPKAPDACMTLLEPNDVMVLRRQRQQREYLRHWRIVESETGLYVYGEATVFYLGLYLDNYVNGTINEVLDLFRALFNGRRILFVGPERPMGGESFRAQIDTMKRIGLRDAQFITVPETNAFEHSDAVLGQILDTTGIDDVFLQAGPAATVWAYQLAGRIDGRVLDVGSFNMQLRYLA